MHDTNTDLLNRLGNRLAAVFDEAPISAEEKTRLQHYAIFLAAGIPTMVIFGCANLSRGNWLLGLFTLLSGMGLFVGFLYLRKLKNGRIVYRINCSLFGLLLIYMMMVGGEGGSKILWMYTFPLIAFFLFGKGEGSFWSAALLAIALLTFWGPLKALAKFQYAGQFEIRFVTSFLIVSAVTYWFEYFREYYRKGIEEKNRVLEEEKSHLQHEVAERQRLERELRRLAGTDPLTGTANRRRFMELAKQELYRKTRYDHNMALAIMDIDNFKKINDTYGHPVGDEVIKALVQYSKIYLRQSDILGRIGGEEFAILLVETNPGDSEKVADRLRRKIAALRLPVEGGDLQFTVSIGVANVNKDDQSLSAVIKRADTALYQAKTDGRNRVVCR